MRFPISFFLFLLLMAKDSLASSKELRIGILAISALVILFTGFYFLKGANLFNGDQEFNCYYPNVDGLLNSANVQINGLNVGRVAYMQLAPVKGVKVVISIYKTVQLPQGTVASLGASDLLGTKIIKLIPGQGAGVMKAGDELKTIREGSVVDNMTGEITPRLRELKGTISAFDTTLSGVNGIVSDENQHELRELLHNLNLTAQNLASMTMELKKETGDITSIIHNANKVTANLASKNDSINKIIDNLAALSRQLANAPVQKSVTELQGAVTQLKDITTKINNNEGSLGMIINNKDLYNNMNSSLKALDSLLSDLKAHPSRYINVTVFGKAKK